MDTAVFSDPARPGLHELPSELSIATFGGAWPAFIVERVVVGGALMEIIGDWNNFKRGIRDGFHDIAGLVDQT